MSKKKAFNPGGQKGKLHRELHVPAGEKIPAKKLAKAEHSKDREVRDDAIRAKTMEGWHHGKSSSTSKELERRISKRNDR